MNKAYNRINWENYPSDATPLNETNLNKIDSATDEIDDRVITLDTTKLDKTTAATMVKDVEYDESTGIFTVTYLNGATYKLDTKLEKLAVNFKYDSETQQLIITLDDGTLEYVDLSELITQYEFLDGSIVLFSISTDGKVSADIADNSITEDKLESKYLAQITVQAEHAAASAAAAANSAAESEDSAEQSADSATLAESWAIGGTGTRTGEDTDNAKYYSQQSANSASGAAGSETNAKESETNAAASAAAAASSAAESEDSAEQSADSANVAESWAIGGTGTRTGEDTDNAKYYSQQSANSASGAAASASDAGTYAEAADESAKAADESAGEASASADTAKNYAMGDTDSAKYYYEQSKLISEGFAGTLIPMGTVAFAGLPDIDDVNDGWMYNISDEFTTTSDFKEGSGLTIAAGSNVYKTADGYWDVLAGSPVTSVNGERGNVEITPEGIGALAETGDTADNTTTFTSGDSETAASWTSVSTLTSGEKHSSIFNKISTMLKNVRYLYNMLGTTDISALGNGTVTGAISSQNETFTQNIEDINTQLEEKQDTVTGGATTIVSSNLTASRALISDSSGKVAVSEVTSTELGYLDGVTSNVQTQLNAKAPTAHASSATTYGGGTSSNYGHVKVSDNYTSSAGAASASVAASSAAVYNCYINRAPISHASSATTYGVGTTSNYGHCKLINNVSTSSYSDGCALSAYQGYVLNNKFSSYLPLSGGTLTGTIYFSNSNISAYGSGTTLHLLGSGYLNLRSPGIQCRSYDDNSWAGISASSYTTQSAKKYKENIEDITDERAHELLKYRVVTYDYINKADGTDCIGLIADEVEEVEKFPVSYNADGEVEGLDYSRFVPQLIRMVQLQQEEIEMLSSAI